MTGLDASELTRFTLHGQLAERQGKVTVTLCPDCYDVLANRADRLGEKDGVTDIRMIQSRRALGNACDRCDRRAGEGSA